MSISTEEHEEFPTSPTNRPVLLLDSQIVPRDRDEGKALGLLQKKSYSLTKILDEDLLTDTGTRGEFNEEFRAVGWENFV